MLDIANSFSLKQVSLQPCQMMAEVRCLHPPPFAALASTRFPPFWIRSQRWMYKEPDNTIRILLATDNHIGYLERDPIRGQDSINTFKEILQLAVKHNVSSASLGRVVFTVRYVWESIHL